MPDESFPCLLDSSSLADNGGDLPSPQSLSVILIVCFASLGPLPVLIDRGRVIPDVLAWLKFQKQEQLKSASTLYSYALALSRFVDFWKWHKTRRDESPILKVFFESLVHGERDLGWMRVAIDHARQFVEIVCIFVDWFVEKNNREDHPNPLIEEPQSFRRLAAESSRRSKSDYLYHLMPTTKRASVHTRRKLQPWARAARGASPNGQRPKKTFLFDNFVALAKLEDNIRNLLLWLVLGTGGIRLCEALNLFTTDIYYDNESGEARILLADPVYGTIHVPSEPSELTRQVYLKEQFALVPREQLPFDHIQWVGWKGMKWHHPETQTADVTWLHPYFGQLFWDLHVKYLAIRGATHPQHPWYFVNCEKNIGEPLSASNAKQVFANLCARLNMQPDNVHSLRHMYVDTLVNTLGLTLEQAQILVRHISAESTATSADVRRLVGAVDSVVKETLAGGSTVLSQQQLEIRLARLLGVPGDSGIVRVAIAAGERNVAILRGVTGWRAPGAALLEENVAAKLSRMLEPSYPCPVQVPSPEELGRLLDSAATSTSALHTEQRSAVMKLMRHAVACLQGGAGTGKTYTMKALCDLYEHLGGRVLLGALAGKAAHRLSKSARRPALTLARIIAQLVEREKVESVLRNSSMDANAATKCSERLKSLIKIDQKTLVVLDEASMVDLPTLHAILRYMPEGARLLLVGCAGQLPPIGFGLVFHLLVNDPEITARLTVIHRQTTQSGIPIVSAAICERRLPPLNEYTGIAEGVSFVHCDSANLGDTVEHIAFDLGGCANGVVAVCPTKKGAGGVEALNARLHERFRNGRPELKGFNGQYYSAGDPVMWLHNDYSRGLFNGLLGQTKSISGDTADRWVEVLFDAESSVRSFGLEDLMDLTLAHAITCHKIQGSQVARVVVPIYESRVLDPSWIYTAITRAEQQVVLVGSWTVLRAALMRPAAAERRMVGFVWPPHQTLKTSSVVSRSPGRMGPVLDIANES